MATVTAGAATIPVLASASEGWEPTMNSSNVRSSCRRSWPTGWAYHDPAEASHGIRVAILDPSGKVRKVS
jgi:hypothetical protein